MVRRRDISLNIWILNHYAETPDGQATRTYDISREMVRRGYMVTVFASSFSHYKFREERLQAGEKWKVESHDGVRFFWLKTPSYRGNNWRRVLNMLTYGWRALWVGKKLEERPDVIIGVSVHPVAALAAYLLSILKKARFFFEVTDLWPQTLVEFGKLSERSPITWGMRALEKFLYRKSEKIIMLWRHTEDYVSRLGISTDKIIWIPHGVDLSRYQDLIMYDGGHSRSFTIMYLGGLVAANALDVVLDAAKILQNEKKRHIRFVFVGDGTEKPRLVQRSRKMALDNVEFWDLVPKQEIAKVLGKADAFIYSLRDRPFYRYGISLNKLCDYLASGRPIIFAGKSSYSPVEEARAGVSVPPENPKLLAQAITDLVGMKAEERLLMGKNGLEYVKKYHDIRVLADRLEALL